jgi:pimeloyl-ACP methyl ester carboxylesterase
MLRLARFFVLAGLGFAGLTASAPAQTARLDGVGVVLLHGKLFGPRAYVGSLIQALRTEGAKVVAPEMPWSRSRMYDATYEQAMEEIDVAVAELKTAGASRIVIVGHSMGANGAIGYAARRSGLAAVIALSPGHLPETEDLREHTAAAVARARKLVEAGRGDERRTFPDRAQGWPYYVSASAKVYLSLFDPDGPAVIPKNAEAMPEVPFLWVVGRNDPIFARGPEYAYERGARHPKSRYMEVEGGHVDAPSTATKEIIAWLKSLQ